MVKIEDSILEYLLPAMLCAEHSYFPASDNCTSEISKLPESTVDNLQMIQELHFLFLKWFPMRFYRFPLKSSNFPFIYHKTEGSGIPRGDSQFRTTDPPTRATVSLGTKRKSSLNTENQNRSHFIERRSNLNEFRSN